MINVINNISIPNHTPELEKAEIFIDELKNSFRDCERLKSIDDEQYESIYGETLRALYLVADLSLPLFEINKELEQEYFKIHINSPELARTLWLKKYHQLHKPYNTLKNRCFSLLDAVEELYITINGHNPKEFAEPIQ